MTTKGDWYQIAEKLKLLANNIDAMVRDPLMPIAVRTHALEANIGLLKLSLEIQAELLKEQPKLPSNTNYIEGITRGLIPG